MLFGAAWVRHNKIDSGCLEKAYAPHGEAFSYGLSPRGLRHAFYMALPEELEFIPIKLMFIFKVQSHFSLLLNYIKATKQAHSVSHFHLSPTDEDDSINILLTKQGFHLSPTDYDDSISINILTTKQTHSVSLINRL